MNYFYLLLFLLSFTFCFSALSDPADSKTEASDPHVEGLTDPCCKREIKTDSAHDMSEQTAQQITQKTLALAAPVPGKKPPRPRRSRGQR